MLRLMAGTLLLLFFVCPPFSVGQDTPAVLTTENSAESEPIDPLKIKLSVNEVRLDVVVLDKKTGNPVTDLTADDFEISQGGRRQDVLASVYIDSQSGIVAQPSVPRKKARNLPPLPTAALKKEDVHRTIIFVVDDLSMSFESTYYAKMALRNFVEKQMQPGDMVAILKTSYGNSALQMFLSDKREILARIDATRLEIKRLMLEDITDYLYRVYDNQLSTISYGIRALKNMPGRKILITMTEETTLFKSPTTINLQQVRNMYSSDTDFNSLYIERFNRLSDEALRAGVVVNFLNILGLNNFKSNYADASMPSPGNAQMQPQVSTGAVGVPWVTPSPLSPAAEISWMRPAGEERMRMSAEIAASVQGDPSVTSGLNPLPVKTGGVIIENSNFFLDGIGKDTESLMKGYYLISYIPPASTFNLDRNGRDVYHRIKINVKRKDTVVYTREGFYGRQESETDADITKDPLIEAIILPFHYADLNVNMTAGYVRDDKSGYLVRSWIHLDPKDVKIVETEDGGAIIDLETMCLTSDISGFVQDFRHLRYAFTIKPENKSENLAWIQKHGIRFTLLLPVKKPGFYYVRIAVRDTESNKAGSAFQFVEIPDLGKKGLELSNIFMLTSTDDINWMNSDVEKELAEGAFSLVFQTEEVRSPALRTYSPGETFLALSILYNADDKAIARSEIETQSILYKDGREYMVTDPKPVNPNSAGNPNGIPVLQGLTIGSDLKPGDYVLQLVVTDKKNSNKKEGVAAQALSFTITED